MKKITFLIFILALTTACSNVKKESDETLADVNIDQATKSEDFVVDAEDESLFAEDATDVKKDVAQESTIVTNDSFVSEVQTEVSEPSLAPTNVGPVATYKVQKGDTLMLIAFKLYGDYSKWKTIKNNNQGLALGSLKEGMEISYPEVAKKFEWVPQGLPHLIVMGETLGIISNEKYGTPKKWKKIYDNNRPLIKNPNSIYAGFTLYYVPEREIASEK